MATATIPKPAIKKMTFTIVGDTPYISHNWSEKATRMMEEKQQKKARQAKEARNPEEDFKSSIYYTEDGKYGVPAIHFKRAAVDAVRFIDGLRMTEARGAFFAMGDILPLRCSDPHMRTDHVRNSSGVADLRYRAQFDTWEVDITVRFNSSFITEEQIINLFDMAGFAIGLGERRPAQKVSDQFGMFHIKQEGEK